MRRNYLLIEATVSFSPLILIWIYFSIFVANNLLLSEFNFFLVSASVLLSLGAAGIWGFMNLVGIVLYGNGRKVPHFVTYQVLFGILFGLAILIYVLESGLPFYSSQGKAQIYALTFVSVTVAVLSSIHFLYLARLEGLLGESKVG